MQSTKLILAVVSSFFALSLPSASLAKGAGKIAVYIEPVKLQTLSDRLIYPAAVTASRVVPVTTEVEGFVKELRAELGQKVERGSPLLWITNPDPIYHYKPFLVTAPFAGVITGIEIAVGDRVQKGRALLTLTDNRELKIKINVTADDLSQLKPKQKAQLVIGEKDWPLQIRALSPMVDTASGTAACELELSDKNMASQLVPGKLGQVVFQVAERRGILVPESAIFYRGRDTFVIRVDEANKARYIPIKILKSGLGLHEIESPQLKEQQRIITHANSYVAEGDELEIKVAEAGT